MVNSDINFWLIKLICINWKWCMMHDANDEDELMNSPMRSATLFRVGYFQILRWWSGYPWLVISSLCSLLHNIEQTCNQKTNSWNLKIICYLFLIPECLTSSLTSYFTPDVKVASNCVQPLCRYCNLQTHSQVGLEKLNFGNPSNQATSEACHHCYI